MMAEAWIDYADIAVALSITPEVARQKAIEGRWRSRRGKDGRAQVLVDLEVEKACHTARPDGRRTIEALEAHIAFLMAAIAKTEALAEQRQREAEAARREIQGKAGEPAVLLSPMAEQSVGEDRARAEFDAYRAPPW
jgi:hypothetical protein